MRRLNKKELAAKSTKFLLKRPSPQHILWLNYAVTYLCNSRCHMCSIWKKYRVDPGFVKEELTLEDIRAFLGSHYLDTLQGVSFTGGEVFLRKDFTDIAGLFIEKFPKAIFAIATNGLKPGLIVQKVKEIQDRYDPEHLSISLSLDGLFEKHDEMRGIGPGAYDSVNKTIELLKSETSVNIGIDFTITPWNYEELLRVYRYTKEKSIRFLACFAHHSDSYYSNAETRFDWNANILDKVGSDLKEIVKDIIRNESLLNRFIDPNAFFLSNCVRYQTGGKTNHRCHSGTHSMFLDPYGNIYPCIILNREMGKIKEGMFERDWISKEAGEIRDNISSRKCRCWVACESVPSMLRGLDMVKWNLKHKFIHGV